MLVLVYCEKLDGLWCSLLLDFCRLKIFVPITLLAWAILVPVNWTNSTLAKSNFTYSNIDKLSISNVPLGSLRFGDLSFKAFENFDAVDLPLQIVLSIFRSSLDVGLKPWKLLDVFLFLTYFLIIVLLSYFDDFKLEVRGVVSSVWRLWCVTHLKLLS